MVSVCRDQETQRMQASMQPQSSQSLVTLWFTSARPGPSGLRQLEVVFLRSQTGVKGLRCPDLATRISQHSSVPTYFRVVLVGIPCPCPEHSAQELGYPSPGCSSLCSPVIWATWSFYPFPLWPLGSRISPSPPSYPLSAWNKVVFALDSSRLLWLFPPVYLL